MRPGRREASGDKRMGERRLSDRCPCVWRGTESGCVGRDGERRGGFGAGKSERNRVHMKQVAKIKHRGGRG